MATPLGISHPGQQEVDLQARRAVSGLSLHIAPTTALRAQAAFGPNCFGPFEFSLILRAAGNTATSSASAKACMTWPISCWRIRFFAVPIGSTWTVTPIRRQGGGAGYPVAGLRIWPTLARAAEHRAKRCGTCQSSVAKAHLTRRAARAGCDSSARSCKLRGSHEPRHSLPDEYLDLAQLRDNLFRLWYFRCNCAPSFSYT